MTTQDNTPSVEQVELVKEAISYLGEFGKVLSPDKNEYRRANRGCVVFWDTYLYTEKFLIWRGDINYTFSREDLVRLSFKVREGLYLFDKKDIKESLVDIPNLNNCIFYTDGKRAYKSVGELVPFFSDDEGGSNFVT